MGVGDAGIGGLRVAWAGWVMEPRNTLNTRKGVCGVENSSSLELEFENGIGDCSVREFDNRIEMRIEGEI